MLVCESRTLGADALTVPTARAFVVDVLRASVWDADTYDAALLTSELAANAVEHAQSEYTVTVDVALGSLRIAVADRSTVFPTLNRELPADTIGGRGLMIVDAIAIATAWGVDPMPAGKSVWFELAK